jgi:predicted nuclease with RNAse H fold
LANCYVGIDVQTRRGCPFAVLNSEGGVLDAGWIEKAEPFDMAAALRSVLNRHASDKESIALAIDAPRVPLVEPRQWYWRGGRWQRRRPQDQGAGRHCEVVIAAHRLANPQWTPSRRPFPKWMELGFELFRQLAVEYRLYEVFPSASYAMLRGDRSLEVRVYLGDLAPGPKDMLDAHVAAATLREFVQGRGCEVGGGDGLGSIILPRPIPNPIQGVLRWPPAQQ